MLTSSLKSIIFSAPAGWGKTHHAARLKALLGCSAVVDEWRPGLPVTGGTLHLTNVRVDQLPKDLNEATCTVINIGWLVNADGYFATRAAAVPA